MAIISLVKHIKDGLFTMNAQMGQERNLKTIRDVTKNCNQICTTF